MSDELTREQVYLTALAGLLHDIGKFAQRAEWLPGRHTEVGGEFVRQFVPECWRSSLYPVMGHHDDPLLTRSAKIIALADRLSAGERVPAEEAQPRQMLSVFCCITADAQQADHRRYWPLAELQMTEQVVFPVEEMAAKDISQAYQRLWNKFIAEAGDLMKAHQEDGNLPVYLENILLLLQRYTWCVPAAYYRALPDVSLYDHSRTTAALAVCLLSQEEATLDRLLSGLKSGERSDELEKAEVALLVGGDISGVQDFIYTITSKGAAGALRGRSFYLQLLTEAVARYILRRLGLPVTNLIYQGGGHFYLLARPSDVTQIVQIQRDISRILLAHHQGDLYLALTAVPLMAADFYDGRISGRWEELSRTLREIKQRRFAELERDDLKGLFAPQGHGGNGERECQVCGREHPETRADRDVRKCPPCRSYESLGDDLRRANYLWLAEREPISPSPELGEWRDVLRALGLEAGMSEKLPNVSGPRWILAVKDAALSSLRPDARTIAGRRFLVNVTPILTEEDRRALENKLKDLPPAGSVKPFEVMAYQSRGIPRLGVLRMDVDNLGGLFSKGLGNRATLSRVAALSFAISLFFEGWVEVLAERIGKATGTDRLYSIYSGGDDLFLVGSWDAVVEMARAVRADFARFVADHPGVHLSAGIALVSAKYPLYQAAQDAGEAEEKAKRLCWKDAQGHIRRKNSVAFLGQALPWHRFGLEPCNQTDLHTVHALAHRLEQMVRGENEEKVPKALLHMLIRLQEMYNEAAAERRRWGEDQNVAGEEQVFYGPWMWRGYYFLQRMAQRYEKTPAISREIKRLAEGLHGEGFRAIEWIGLAARWAELMVRETSA